MSQFLHRHMDELPVKHKDRHPDYTHDRRDFVPIGFAEHCAVSVYEVPPGKAAYPYHYHHKNEETFFIISGEGILRTPEGERPVKAGDLCFFPAGEEGAHKLTNTSQTEKLIYIDFDVVHDVDVTQYPDSNKIAVWGKGINKQYRLDEDVDYYDGE